MRRTHEDVHDELLVLRCQDGDREALKELIDRWQPKLVRLAWRLTREPEAARDIVQDAWFSIVRGIGRLSDPASFRTWAYRIVNNKCADWLRRRVVRRNAATDLARAAEERQTTEAESDREEVDELRAALRSLPDEQQAILSLHYLDGLGIAEIASVLGIPSGTVKSRLFHARATLRATLERTETWTT